MILEFDWKLGEQYGVCAVDLELGLMANWPADRRESVKLSNCAWTMGELEQWVGETFEEVGPMRLTNSDGPGMINS